MSELIKRQDAINAVAQLYRYESDRMTALQEVPAVTEQEIRNKAIDEAIEASAKAICVGCGYLDGHKCTYKGANCSVSKPMLKVVVEALEQMKGGE